MKGKLGGQAPDPVGTARRIVALDQAREALLASQTYWREKAEAERESAWRRDFGDKRLWEYQAQSYCFAAAAERLKSNMEMFARRLHHEIREFLNPYLRRFGSDFRPNADDVAAALEVAGGDRAVAARHLRIAALGSRGYRASLEVSADVVLHTSRHEASDPAETPSRLAWLWRQARKALFELITAFQGFLYIFTPRFVKNPLYDWALRPLPPRFRRLRGLVQLWTPNNGRHWRWYFVIFRRRNPDPIETATRWITVLGQAREALLNVVTGADTNEARTLKEDLAEELAETMMLLAYHISAELDTAY